MPNPTQGLIQSIVDLNGKIYELKLGERERADFLTKRTRRFVVKYFPKDVELLVTCSKIDWADVYEGNAGMPDQGKWHRSHVALIHVGEGMLDRLRLSDPPVSLSERTGHDGYRSGFIILTFLLLSFLLWYLKDIGEWSRLYEPRRRFAICMSGQLFLLWAVIALMVPLGKNRSLLNVVVAFATIISAIIGVLR